MSDQLTDEAVKNAIETFFKDKYKESELLSCTVEILPNGANRAKRETLRFWVFKGEIDLPIADFLVEQTTAKQSGVEIVNLKYGEYPLGHYPRTLTLFKGKIRSWETLNRILDHAYWCIKHPVLN